MRILTQRAETESISDYCRANGKTIGFVPTMGALHQGHLNLIKLARTQNDVVFVSIFVNPEQFNNAEDFRLYPRNTEEDSKLLQESGCDFLFLPTTDQVFSGPVIKNLDLGGLDQKLEGRFRPGHFQGVAAVVSELLRIIKPHKAYFGKKDIQQVKVVEKLVKAAHIPVEIISCDTIRESDGLAMSSRNLRLSPEARKQSAAINQALNFLAENKSRLNPSQLVSEAIKQMEMYPDLKVEYLEIVDPETFEPILSFQDGKEAVACVAVYAGGVRLIDNISL